MQDLGAEVGELRGLFEADGLDAQGFGDDARIGGHDAVDVGPDFDGARVQAAADESGSVVRSAASKRGSDAFRVGADEAPQDGRLAGLHQRKHQREQLRFNRHLQAARPCRSASR